MLVVVCLGGGGQGAVFLFHVLLFHVLMSLFLGCTYVSDEMLEKIRKRKEKKKKEFLADFIPQTECLLL